MTTALSVDQNLDTTTINVGYRRKWVFGTHAQLADGAYSQHSRKYESHEEAWAAAVEYWESLNTDEQAQIVRTNKID